MDSSHAIINSVCVRFTSDPDEGLWLHLSTLSDPTHGAGLRLDTCVPDGMPALRRLLAQLAAGVRAATPHAGPGIGRE